MNAPRRWIDDGGSATPFERDLLRSARSIDPPPGAQSQVFAALLTRIPPPGGPGISQGAGSAAKATAAKGAASGAAMAAASGILKGALIGAGSAVALIATYTVVAPARRSEPPGNPPPVHAPLQAAAPRANAAPGGEAHAPDGLAGRPDLPAPVAVDAPAVGAPTAAADHRVAPAPSAPAVPAAAPAEGTERETMLREEGRQVSEARDAMRRGDAPGALALLEQVRVRFPGGVLVQEREALAIEALARSGRRSDASARAAAFLKAYPTSMFAERVQAFAR